MSKNTMITIFVIVIAIAAIVMFTNYRHDHDSPKLIDEIKHEVDEIGDEVGHEMDEIKDDSEH